MEKLKVSNFDSKLNKFVSTERTAEVFFLCLVHTRFQKLVFVRHAVLFGAYSVWWQTHTLRQVFTLSIIPRYMSGWHWIDQWMSLRWKSCKNWIHSLKSSVHVVRWLRTIKSIWDRCAGRRRLVRIPHIQYRLGPTANELLSVEPRNKCVCSWMAFRPRWPNDTFAHTYTHPTEWRIPTGINYRIALQYHQRRPSVVIIYCGYWSRTRTHRVSVECEHLTSEIIILFFSSGPSSVGSAGLNAMHNSVSWKVIRMLTKCRKDVKGPFAGNVQMNEWPAIETYACEWLNSVAMFIWNRK